MFVVCLRSYIFELTDVLFKYISFIYYVLCYFCTRRRFHNNRVVQSHKQFRTFRCIGNLNQPGVTKYDVTHISDGMKLKSSVSLREFLYKHIRWLACILLLPTCFG
jgi:hypothetical protein